MAAIPGEVYQVTIGIVVTVALGFAVGPILAHVSRVIPIPAPNDDPETVRLWTRLTGQTTGGAYIGFFERFIFFAAFWSPAAWPIFPSWLAFKLALYWQGAKFASFPDQAPGHADLAWLVAKRQLGAHHVATALVGTAASVAACLAGVAIGKLV